MDDIPADGKTKPGASIKCRIPRIFLFKSIKDFGQEFLSMPILYLHPYDVFFSAAVFCLTRRITRPPSAVNFTALYRILTSTCFSFSSSNR